MGRQLSNASEQDRRDYATRHIGIWAEKGFKRLLNTWTSTQTLGEALVALSSPAYLGEAVRDGIRQLWCSARGDMALTTHQGKHSCPNSAASDGTQVKATRVGLSFEKFFHAHELFESDNFGMTTEHVAGSADEFLSGLGLEHRPVRPILKDLPLPTEFLSDFGDATPPIIAKIAETDEHYLVAAALARYIATRPPGVGGRGNYGSPLAAEVFWRGPVINNLVKIPESLAVASLAKICATPKRSSWSRIDSSLCAACSLREMPRSSIIKRRLPKWTYMGLSRDQVQSLAAASA